MEDFYRKLRIYGSGVCDNLAVHVWSPRPIKSPGATICENKCSCTLYFTTVLSSIQGLSVENGLGVCAFSSRGSKSQLQVLFFSSHPNGQLKHYSIFACYSFHDYHTLPYACFWLCVWSEVDTLTAGALDIICLHLGASLTTDKLCDLGKVAWLLCSSAFSSVRYD